MTERVLFVLTERGTSAEAEEARAIWKGRSVVMGTASAHEPGQKLAGDVVVIGPGATTVEQDAKGEVKRYASLADARAASEPFHADKTVAELRDEAHDRGVELPSRARKDEIVEAIESAPPDPTDGMSRVEMIQMAAQKWPGARRWATLSNDDLVEEIRRLDASD